MKLVIGAGGFLGSHVVRRLVASGDAVRVLIRESSDTRAIADLDVERFVGELFDTDVVAAAMADCDAVFYCAVDTRAWLTDPGPLVRTNVDALRSVLEVAAGAGLQKFVYTSTIATIGRVTGRLATETDAFNWNRQASDYVKSRVAAEDMALSYARDQRVPVVAMCVANTYGERDLRPTPHGQFVAAAALGTLPFTVRGCRAESVGVDDAADALILAAAKGRVGERYIISERVMDLGEIITIAASAGNRRPPRLVLHRPALYVIGALGSARAALTRSSVQLTLTSVRLMNFMSPADHSKAEIELDWHPRPVTDSITAGARFWVDRVAQRASR